MRASTTWACAGEEKVAQPTTQPSGGFFPPFPHKKAGKSTGFGTWRAISHTCDELYDCGAICQHHHCGNDCDYDCDYFVCEVCTPTPTDPGKPAIESSRVRKKAAEIKTRLARNHATMEQASYSVTCTRVTTISKSLNSTSTMKP